MASGKTLLMRNIRASVPVVLHRHVGAPRHVRRQRKSKWTGSFVPNEPYEYPARDHRKGRKLRTAE